MFAVPGKGRETLQCRSFAADPHQHPVGLLSAIGSIDLTGRRTLMNALDKQSATTIPERVECEGRIPQGLPSASARLSRR